MNTQTHNPCPNCHYVRCTEDTAPAWQCPSCGIAYEKFNKAKAAATGNTQKIASPSSEPGKTGRFKAFRIAILITILAVVATDALLTKLRTTSWTHPLRVVVYPINADGSEAAERYLSQLTETQFDAIEQRVQTEAARYTVKINDPITIALADPVSEVPPLPPRNGNVFAVMWWSLKLRLWANNMDHYTGPQPEVRAFALYYDPATHPVLEHSTGLEKGMIGVIKLFATHQMDEQNDMVMLHELLHTLGATDKYDLNTNLPLYPDGYAEPGLQPRLPQHQAEIMAGRIALTAHHAEMPTRLDDVVIGPKTAREIGWIK